jgi:hypothetical protein
VDLPDGELELHARLFGLAVVLRFAPA